MFLFNESTKKAINDYSLAVKGLELLVEEIIRDLPKNLKETYIFQKIKEHKLDMTLTDVEYKFDM